MSITKFFRDLQSAGKVIDVESAIDNFVQAHRDEIKWVPVGHRENNRGTIEVSADPGRSLVERVTNGIDAILEMEYEAHGGVPVCRSPREAASSWLRIPAEGISGISKSERRDLAKKIIIGLFPGEGKDSRTVEIRDTGVGIKPDMMSKTILSLNEGNKVQKHHLVGVYGQGGSSTFAVSKYTLIASRYKDHPTVGFTVVRYLDLPPEEFKTGHYVYLTLNNSILQAEIGIDAFQAGTQVKHFGYEMSSYSSPLGPNSIYGILNSILFDPTLPVWLDNQIHAYRRVIKGSRNALNGAVDEGDERERGPELAHNMRMFYADLGDYGRIGIEYWVLKRSEGNHTNPTASFVNPSKPIVLTINGQSHAEFSKHLIKKDAELPYLSNRLIGHIDCNSLTPAAKRAFFVSSREDVRRGAIYELIQQEFVKALKSDDALASLNNEARVHDLETRDENAVQQMRSEVARILRTQGFNVLDVLGGSGPGGNTPTETPLPQPHGRVTLAPIPPNEPPTYIRILWEESKPITFYPGQRRYIRIETDANSIYHNPNDPSRSKINIIASQPGAIIPRGSTPLLGGRLRAIFESDAQSAIGDTGIVRVELTRQGLPVLSDERPFSIVAKPPSRPSDRSLSLPPFELVPINPNQEIWAELGWSSDISTVASEAIESEGKLMIYYSTVFPGYAGKRTTFEQRDTSLADSFTKRYEVWLAVHSLLLNKERQPEVPAEASNQMPQVESVDDLSESYEKKERCRMATMSALFAAREVQYQPTQTETE